MTADSDALLRAYEQMPYEDLAVAETHVDVLATAARLAGIDAASVGDCRVLEIGCASGNNLLPMAEALPASRFVGIDLAPSQVAAGEATIARLGLENLTLRAGSIVDLPLEGEGGLGEFDYILCHGVYSWVPEVVRRRILEICRRCLAMRGVAYISYNTYPGWHHKEALRRMMAFHVAPLRAGRPGVDGSPVRQCEQARALIEMLAAATHKPDSGWGRSLKERSEELAQHVPSYIFHDYLEAYNAPCYFSEFVAELGKERLQYLGAAGGATALDDLRPEAREVLGPLRADRIRLEQYIDFVTGQTFRRSLITHAGVPLARVATAAAMKGLLVRALVPPTVAPPDDAALRDPAYEMEFTGSDARLVTGNLLYKATLMALHRRRPRPLEFEALHAATEEILGAPVDADELAQVIERCWRGRLASVHSWLDAALPDASATDRPRARAAARVQAERKMPVANLRHELVSLDAFDLMMLPLLDGTRDRDALAAAMTERLDANGVGPRENGQLIEDPARVRELVARSVEESLRSLTVSEVLCS